MLGRDSSSRWAEAGRPRQQAGQGGEPSERGRAPGPPGQSGILGELTVHPGLISHPTSSRSCLAATSEDRSHAAGQGKGLDRHRPASPSFRVGRDRLT